MTADAPDAAPQPSRARRLLDRVGAHTTRAKTPAETPKPPAAPKPSAPRAARTNASRSKWDVAAVAVLSLLVMAIVVVGLRVGMGALEDAAKAVHIENDAAQLYWIGVDGLIVVAIVAALVLRHDPVARKYCLVVVGVFTGASGLLQYLHGLGWFTPDKATGVLKPLPWGVVLVVAFLVIGMIFCATHLLVHTLRRLFPGVQPAEEPAEAATDEQRDDIRDAPQVVYQPAPPDPEEIARIVYSAALDLEVKVGRDRLAKACGISSRTAGRIRTDVEVDREEAAARDAAEKAARETEEAARAQRAEQAAEPVPAVAPEVRERITRMRKEALMDIDTLVSQGANGSTPQGGA